jgi:hypothetical protein
MGHFYPVLARAFAELKDGAGEFRRVVYERAQAALMAELASAKPPPTAQHIDREYQALNSAIRRIEAEAARASGEMSAVKLSNSKGIVMRALALGAQSQTQSRASHQSVLDLVELLPD